LAKKKERPTKIDASRSYAMPVIMNDLPETILAAAGKAKFFLLHWIPCV
jgi:hypothetical protein